MRTILIAGVAALVALAAGCGAPERPVEIAAEGTSAGDTIVATAALTAQESGLEYRELVWLMRPVGEPERTLDCTVPEPGVVRCEQHTVNGDAANHGGDLVHTTNKIVTTTFGGCVMSDGQTGDLIEVDGVPGGEKFETTRGEEIYFHSQSRACQLGDLNQNISGGWVVTGGTGRFEGASATMSGVRDPIDGVNYQIGILRVRQDLWDDEFDFPIQLSRIKPGVAGVVEGAEGQTLVEVPVTLAFPWSEPVTVDWATLDTGDPGIATAGVDYVAASGSVTFAPGETAKTIPISVNGDTDVEPALLYGEWGLIEFSNPSPNAVVDITKVDGRGVFIIVDDD